MVTASFLGYRPTKKVTKWQMYSLYRLSAYGTCVGGACGCGRERDVVRRGAGDTAVRGTILLYNSYATCSPQRAESER